MAMALDPNILQHNSLNFIPIQHHILQIPNHYIQPHTQFHSYAPLPPYYCSKPVSVVGNSQRNKELIKWIPPPNGFIKINTDASIRSDGTNGFGIVFRDERGFWRLGCCGYYTGDQFDKKMGPKSNTVVEGELRAITTAILLAIENDYRRVIIESDSLTAINMIKSGDTKSKNLTNDSIDMVLECRELISQIGSCFLEHTKREGNFCADKMADLGSQSGELMQIFENAPKEVIPYLMADYWGFQFQRGLKLTEDDIRHVCMQVSRR